MKPLGGHECLGVAMGDRAITLAEASAGRPHATVRRTAEFVFPPGLSLDNPVEVGQALRAFLRNERFTASAAVVGVPARWLMARDKEIPPAGPDVAASTLRLQAERDFGADARDLALDYVGRPDAARPRRVLLVAMQRAQLDRITQALTNAGLTVRAVTSSALALAGMLRPAPGEPVPAAGQSPAGHPWLLSISADSAELVGGTDGSAPLLRHLPVPAQAAGNGSAAAALSAIGGELRRVVALQAWAAAPSSQGLVIWDALGLEDHAGAELARRAGLEVRPRPAPADAVTPRFGPAVALARAGLADQPLPLDLLHSRLTQPPKTWLSARTVRFGVLGLVLLAAVVAFLVALHRRRSQLAALDTQLKAMRDDVHAAKVLNASVHIARDWFDQRPDYLACLREVTGAFPEQGTIWASGLSLRENGKGLLSGRATDQKTFLGVLDRLRANPRFAEVTPMEMREAGGGSREWTFSLSFAYKRADPAGPAPRLTGQGGTP